MLGPKRLLGFGKPWRHLCLGAQASASSAPPHCLVSTSIPAANTRHPAAHATHAPVTRAPTKSRGALIRPSRRTCAPGALRAPAPGPPPSISLRRTAAPLGAALLPQAAPPCYRVNALYALGALPACASACSDACALIPSTSHFLRRAPAAAQARVPVRAPGLTIPPRPCALHACPRKNARGMLYDRAPPQGLVITGSLAPAGCCRPTFLALSLSFRPRTQAVSPPLLVPA
jgi:hypothetical protein